MELSGTPTLTGYYCEDFPFPASQSCLLLRKEEIRLRNSIRFKFMNKTRMPNPFKSLGYIKCYSRSSSRPVKTPSNSVRYNCQKTCCWSRRPKTILEIRKRLHFSKCSTRLLFTSFSKTLLTTERRLTSFSKLIS